MPGAIGTRAAFVVGVALTIALAVVGIAAKGIDRTIGADAVVTVHGTITVRETAHADTGVVVRRTPVPGSIHSLEVGKGSLNADSFGRTRAPLRTLAATSTTTVIPAFLAVAGRRADSRAVGMPQAICASAAFVVGVTLAVAVAIGGIAAKGIGRAIGADAIVAVHGTITVRETAHADTGVIVRRTPVPGSIHSLEANERGPGAEPLGRADATVRALAATAATTVVPAFFACAVRSAPLVASGIFFHCLAHHISACVFGKVLSVRQVPG